MTEQPLDASKSNPRQLQLKMWGWLIAFFTVLFGLFLSIGCYFNLVALRIIEWTFPVLVVAFFIPLVRKVRRSNYVIPTSKGPKSIGPYRGIGFAFMQSILMFAPWCWFVLYCLASIVLFASANVPMKEQSKLAVTVYKEGRCRVTYAYESKSISRKIRECGVAYFGSESGDAILIVGKVGPLGMRLDRIEKSLDPGMSAKEVTY